MTLFEDQIKHYRKQAGLSQEKMAEKIGVSRQAITKWENGTGTPDISNLMAIANLFQISIDELLSNGKTESKKSEYIYESRTEYDNVTSHEGAIEINQLSATSRLIIPENFCFRSAKKGIANTIYYEKYGKKVESFSNDESDNYIELNGIKSELVIAIDEA